MDTRERTDVPGQSGWILTRCSTQVCHENSRTTLLCSVLPRRCLTRNVTLNLIWNMVLSFCPSLGFPASQVGTVIEWGTHKGKICLYMKGLEQTWPTLVWCHSPTVVTLGPLLGLHSQILAVGEQGRAEGMLRLTAHVTDLYLATPL